MPLKNTDGGFSFRLEFSWDLPIDRLTQITCHAFGMSAFTVDGVNNERLIHFSGIVKANPTFIHQRLLWNVDAIPVDEGVVFFKDAFALFRDSTDFETQCVSKESFGIPCEYGSVYKSAVKKPMPAWLDSSTRFLRRTQAGSGRRGSGIGAR